MCGIAGVVGGDHRRAAANALKMAGVLRHRGPNDEGYLTYEGAGAPRLWSGDDTDPNLTLPRLSSEVNAAVVLAHRRLSILDLSVAGHQPMSGANGRLWLVFNGEIYNYLELRHELKALGHEFRTECDTEVLLAAYTEWGDRAIARFRGMFAFALLDIANREVLLARDPFGIKPLYYARTADGAVAFASEMKALVALSNVTSRVDATALFEFLRFGVSDHGDRTVFADVRQVPAGHALRVGIDGAPKQSAQRYYSLPQRTGTVTTQREAGDVIRAAMADSVRMHMRSDVPVGSCLSGGLDSTLITAQASEMMPAGSLFQTVSYISDDPETSEGPYVELAARTYRICAHRVELSFDDVRNDIEDVIYTQDAPFGSLSMYAQYAVFRCARSHGLTVMLDGQGSDELLGGYTTAVSAAVAELLATGRFAAALSLAKAFDPIGRGVARRTVLSALGRFVPSAVAPLFLRAVGEPLCPEWLDEKWFRNRGVEMKVRPQGRGRSALGDELRLFTEQLSLPQLLRYEDRNSMAFSIESRVPFCDVSFAAAVATIPTKFLVTDTGETKSALRAAARGIVPDAIIDRRKVGFATPDQKWLAALKPWLLDILNKSAERLPFFNAAAFRPALESAFNSPQMMSQAYWRALSALLWADTFSVESG